MGLVAVTKMSAKAPTLVAARGMRPAEQVQAPGQVERAPAAGHDFSRIKVAPQAPPSAGLGLTDAPPIVHEVLQSPGQPLDMATRETMQSRLGYDFSSVRVHTDAKAAESARAVKALAYTVGSDVVLGEGQRAEGRLLGHELAHVVQQTSPRPLGAQRGPVTSTGQVSSLRRWKRSGNTVTVDRETDRLWNLAHSITGDGRDWACIWPREMQSPEAWGDHYELYLRIGDRFDVSNLATSAPRGAPQGTFVFEDQSDVFLSAVQHLYGGEAVFDVDMQIAERARYGATPIRHLTLGGHVGAGSTTMRGGGRAFEPAHANLEEPAPTGARARTRSGPRRCWFARDADVRLVGCSTQALAAQFARAYLRRGARTFATRSWICGWSTRMYGAILRYLTVEPGCLLLPRGRLLLTARAANSYPGLWEVRMVR